MRWEFHAPHNLSSVIYTTVHNSDRFIHLEEIKSLVPKQTSPTNVMFKSMNIEVSYRFHWNHTKPDDIKQKQLVNVAVTIADFALHEGQYQTQDQSAFIPERKAPSAHRRFLVLELLWTECREDIHQRSSHKPKHQPSIPKAAKLTLYLTNHRIIK